MESGPSRKRLRRSTRSCYQCRKRKVKCQLTDEDVETCAECVKSNIRCTLQQPESELSNDSSPAHPNKQDHELRLERIELLLNRLVEAQQPSQSVSGSLDPESTVPSSLWNDLFLYPTTDGTLPLLADHSPVLPDTPDAKQLLVALLPSVEDAVSIVTNTTAWLWGAESPPGSVLKPSDTLELLDITAISKGNAMHVAKTLLLFALYMQQLPGSFDVQFMQSQSVGKTIEVIVERVKSFILSDEDKACSFDGIECLTLLSLTQLNDGAIRKAWMNFRRTLDIARLKGLRNSFSLSARNSTCSDIGLSRRLWLSTACGDCYCSLLLGLEPGIGYAPFGPDDDAWNDPLSDGEANVQRRICLIVARIAQRNAAGLHQDRQAFQEIDEALNRLQDSLPPSWWRVPSFSQGRSLDSSKDPNRLICQLWFFQARIFAHMPIAFGRTMDDSSTSLQHCMEACRITLHRYLGLQYAKDQLSRCRSVDQSASVASIVLLLAKVQHQFVNMDSTASKYDSDRALLEQVLDCFEAIGQGCVREYVARQSAEILTTLLDIAADAENELFRRSNPTSDSNTSLTTGTPFDSAVAIEFDASMAKSGMEDVITSSIQPALDPDSPASRLISLFFATKRSPSVVSKHTQGLSQIQAGLEIDDLIDSTGLE